MRSSVELLVLEHQQTNLCDLHLSPREKVIQEEEVDLILVVIQISHHCHIVSMFMETPSCLLHCLFVGFSVCCTQSNCYLTISTLYYFDVFVIKLKFQLKLRSRNLSLFYL